ncbi:hypothetical protein [Roseicyclus marinus]|nr:hypothetical protein [Roseicyclus marinus]
MLALAGLRAGLFDEPRQYPAPRKVETCNLTPEEIAVRDRPMSRQERRQIERLKKKGRVG